MERTKWHGFVVEHKELPPPFARIYHLGIALIPWAIFGILLSILQHHAATGWFFGE